MMSNRVEEPRLPLLPTKIASGVGVRVVSGARFSADTHVLQGNVDDLQPEGESQDRTSRPRGSSKESSRSYPRQKQTVPMTISDDRSKGSEFEQSGRILTALQRPQTKDRHTATSNINPTNLATEKSKTTIASSTSNFHVDDLLGGAASGQLISGNSSSQGQPFASTSEAIFSSSYGANYYLSNCKLSVEKQQGNLSESSSQHNNDEYYVGNNMPYKWGTTVLSPSLVDIAQMIEPTNNRSPVCASSKDFTNPKMSSSSSQKRHHDEVALDSSDLDGQASTKPRPKRRDTVARYKPPQLIDITALGIPKEVATSFEDLRAYMVSQHEAEQSKKVSRLKIVYRIEDKKDSKLFFDQPHWVFGENGSKTLSSSLPVSNISAYLDKHIDIAFVVYRIYDMQVMKAPDVTDDESGTSQEVEHTSETIQPSNVHLGRAIAKLLLHGEKEPRKTMEGLPGSIKEAQGLRSPYLPIYHGRRNMSDFLNTLNDEQQRHFRILLDYVLDQYGQEYDHVDMLLGERKITYSSIGYLFRPGDLLVCGEGHNARAYTATDWLFIASVLPSSQSNFKKEIGSIKCEYWDYDGSFSRQSTVLNMELNSADASRILISELSVKPLRFCPHVTDKLRHRGEMFWKCRFRHFVSYREEKSQNSHHSGDERFMVDLIMYRQLHKHEDRDKKGKDKVLTDDLGPEVMKDDNPPDGDFVYLLPLTIKGYSLKRKKWLDLEVNRLSEVVWNKDAFDSLVLQEKTKRLIRALVSNQIEDERSTDLISGKGNGLILLLHGGPGTGKTLTAESVAEIAEKPLYPVTCGDIGTEPEMVETYLESVLTLGKTWGCVVLLDEADVFLEQRSLADLKRNALVSVFLRVLEYYDGILILTSNRVGTFDEAFKSRIQLALNYPSLSGYQRTKIWENFISRLQKLNERDVDFSDLKDNVESLAKHKMNGREIRNVLTTARQSARWEGKILNYKFLEDIIDTAGQFNTYIEKLNGGCTQDQLAEEDGWRVQESKV